MIPLGPVAPVPGQRFDPPYPQIATCLARAARYEPVTRTITGCRHARITGWSCPAPGTRRGVILPLETPPVITEKASVPAAISGSEVTPIRLWLTGRSQHMQQAYEALVRGLRPSTECKFGRRLRWP